MTSKSDNSESTRVAPSEVNFDSSSIYTVSQNPAVTISSTSTSAGHGPERSASVNYSRPVTSSEIQNLGYRYRVSEPGIFPVISTVVRRGNLPRSASAITISSGIPSNSNTVPLASTSNTIRVPLDTNYRNYAPQSGNGRPDKIRKLIGKHRNRKRAGRVGNSNTHCPLRSVARFF